jgi:hypothetical protein
VIVNSEGSTANLPTLVLAGNYKEYLEWRRKHPEIHDCKYVESLEDVRGLHAFLVNLVFYGSYQSNPLYNTPKMQAMISENRSRFKSYVKIS